MYLQQRCVGSAAASAATFHPASPPSKQRTHFPTTRSPATPNPPNPTKPSPKQNEIHNRRRSTHSPPPSTCSTSCSLWSCGAACRRACWRAPLAAAAAPPPPVPLVVFPSPATPPACFASLFLPLASSALRPSPLPQKTHPPPKPQNQPPKKPITPPKTTKHKQVCARGVAAGALTVGDTVLFLTLMAQLYAPLNYFGALLGFGGFGGFGVFLRGCLGVVV